MIYGNKQEVMIHVYTYCVDTIIQLRNTPSVSCKHVRTYVRTYVYKGGRGYESDVSTEVTELKSSVLQCTVAFWMRVRT